MTILARITEAIGKQQQETIKERIAEIIAIELPAQYALSVDAGDDETVNILGKFFVDEGETPKVYLDREDDLQSTELNGIIIRNSTEEYQHGSAAKKRVTATYEVAILAAEPATDEADGTVLARRSAQRVAKIVHKILASGYYLTLGFEPGEIGGRFVKSLTTYQPTNQTADIADYIIATSFEIDVTYDDIAITAQPVQIIGMTTTISPDTGAFVVVNGEPEETPEEEE